MTEEPSLTAIDRELVRIGFDEDELPALVLPTGVSLGDLLTMLQALPTGAGPEAFEQLMLSLRWPVQAPWDDWPDPGERFSVSDYVAALRLVNFSPLEVAEEYAAPPRHVPTWILAALSLASPGLERSVAEYLSETRRDRLAAGIRQKSSTWPTSSSREVGTF